MRPKIEHYCYVFIFHLLSVSHHKNTLFPTLVDSVPPSFALPQLEEKLELTPNDKIKKLEWRVHKCNEIACGGTKQPGHIFLCRGLVAWRTMKETSFLGKVLSRWMRKIVSGWVQKWGLLWMYCVAQILFKSENSGLFPPAAEDGRCEISCWRKHRLISEKVRSTVVCFVILNCRLRFCFSLSWIPILGTFYGKCR